MSKVYEGPAMSRWRWAVQLGALALTLVIGWQFYVFYNQAVSGGPITAQRPSGVESYLPISAFLGLRQFFATGEWDRVHPAGLTFLMALIVSCLLFRRVFCSWVCPVGTVSRVLERAHRSVGIFRWQKSLPKWADAVLLSGKYALMISMLWAFSTMPIAGVKEFLVQPYNMAVDANMLRLFTNLSAKGWLTLAGLGVFSFVVINGWCRFLCPYGAMLALVGLVSPFWIGRDAGKCTSCRKCTKACGVGIVVHAKTSVRSPECTMCHSCLSACPEEGALMVKSAVKKPVPSWLIPVGGVGLLVAAYLAAKATGRWDTYLTPENFRYFYMMGLRR